MVRKFLLEIGKLFRRIELGFTLGIIVAIVAISPVDTALNINPKDGWDVALLILILIVIAIAFVSVFQVIGFLLIWLGKETSHERPFIIQMTKPQFERTLDSFVNKLDSSILSTPNILIGWRVLRQRKKVIDEIVDADSIKLTKEPFRGLVLELTEKQTGLWVAVNPEGDKESITVTEKRKRSRFLQFRHVGWKYISVNPKAHNDLLKWLKALEKIRNGEKE